MTSSVNDLLVDAIMNSRLREVLAGLTAGTEQTIDLSPGDHDEIASSKLAIDELDKEVDNELSRIADLLAEQGIVPSTIAPASPSQAIYAVALTVPWQQLEATANVLEAAGYRSDLRNDRALWERFVLFHKSHTFLADDQQEFRVQLQWTPEGFASRIPDRFQPSLDDLSALTLPIPLAPAYAAVKTVRQLLGQRQPSATDLGPFLGTPDGLIPHLLEFSGIGADQLLVDLGCGDGRILLQAAKQFGCNAVGYETDESLVAAARQEITPSLADRVTIETVDAKEADVSNADVVFVFLPIPALKMLVPDLLQRMKPGAVLLAHEQERLETSIKPEERRAMVHRDGVTVAHKWRAGSSSL